jgi:serine/threonine protein kinase
LNPGKTTTRHHQIKGTCNAKVQCLICRIASHYICSSKIDKSHPNPIHQFRSWQLQESQCDLLEQLVRFDPNQRPSAFQALRHPYLDDLHDEDAAELKVEGAFRISTKNAGR